jgi:hypothetical protein
MNALPNWMDKKTDSRAAGGIWDGQLYGGADAWPVLEEGSYQIVQDLLFEKQEEEERELLRLEHHPQEEEQQQLEVGQEPPQVILASLSFFCLCLFRIIWLLT